MRQYGIGSRSKCLSIIDRRIRCIQILARHVCKPTVHSFRKQVKKMCICTRGQSTVGMRHQVEKVNHRLFNKGSICTCPIIVPWHVVPIVFKHISQSRRGIGKRIRNHRKPQWRMPCNLCIQNCARTTKTHQNNIKQQRTKTSVIHNTLYNLFAKIAKFHYKRCLSNKTPSWIRALTSLEHINSTGP